MRHVYQLSSGKEKEMNIEIIHGVHTYSVSSVLTYKQYKKINTSCRKTGCIDTNDDADENVFDGVQRLYCYQFQDRGIKVFLYAESGRFYHLRVQIEPCRVLGETDPTALFSQMDKYCKMVHIADYFLNKLEIPLSIDEMKICRCDTTVNITFPSHKMLEEYLRIIKKGGCIPSYQRSRFHVWEEKVKDTKKANQHSHCICNDRANFVVYDKIAQLEMIDRCCESVMGKTILRLEAEEKRPALKSRLGTDAMESNYILLDTAIRKSRHTIAWYMNQMLPECEHYLAYKDAAALIERSKATKKTKARMLYLLRKASDSDNLDYAFCKLKKEYGLNNSQCKTVFKNFKKLGISPITLRNDSKYAKLPSWDSILEETEDAERILALEWKKS